MLRYQENLLQIHLKEEKAKLKVHQMRGDPHGLSRTADINAMLALKLENDRFREKIAALDKALFEVCLISWQEDNILLGNTGIHQPVASHQMGGQSFKKKSGVQHVNKLTGKTDQGLKDKIKEYELWQRYLSDSKNELQRLSKLISDHSRP